MIDAEVFTGFWINRRGGSLIIMIPDSHGYFESKMKVPLFYGLTTLLLWSPVLTQIVDEQTSFGPPKHGQGIY